jgi:hypothetical protein
MHHEYDVDGRPRMWVTFDVMNKDVVGRWQKIHNVKKARNPEYNEKDTFDWFLKRPVQNWLRTMNFDYHIYWRETTFMVSWKGSRYHVLEISLPSANAAMLFKLAWGGSQ